MKEKPTSNSKSLVNMLFGKKRIVKSVSSIIKIIAMIFLGIIRWVVSVVSIITGISANIVAFLIALVLFICVIGTSVVIITEDLKFVVDPGTYNSEDKNSSGKNLTDYEKWILMANALDRDLIESDYDSMQSMQQFFEDYKIYGVDSKSKQFPAKWIDLFLLVDEIYNRPEVNGDSYTGKIASEFLWGSWQSESGFSQGTGTRLTNSYVRYEKDYSSNCCIPLGIQEEQYTQYYDFSGYYHIGGTYICKQEFLECPDEQRGIMGGAAALFDHKTAKYYAEGDIMRRTNNRDMKVSDPAYQYLASQTLPNYGNVRNGDKRGYISWLPDVFYNFAMINRVAVEGYDRDTQNPGSAYNMANKLALDEIASQVQMTPEEIGIMADIIYDNGRFTRENVELWPNNPEANKTDYIGTLASIELVMVCEGMLDEMANATVSNPDMVKHNYAIGDYFLGECKIKNTSSFVYKEDSYYGKVLKAIEDGTLKRTYPDYILTQAKKLKDYQNGLSCLGIGSSQKTVRLLYAVGNYCKGKLVQNNIGKLITAYYNYQDDSGDYRYRLYEVDLGDEEQSDSVNVGSGNGAFGLPYYNDDGSVNEVAVIAANNLFLELASLKNEHVANLTIPNSVAVTLNNETINVTVPAGGQTYPNFWSEQHNGNASGGWGQCTWWSKGRAMMYLYENVSHERSVWGICNPTNKDCKYAYIRGNGYEIADNINSRTGWGLLRGDVDANKANTVVSNSRPGNHTWYIEAVDMVNKKYYMSHGNFRGTHIKDGFYAGSGKCMSEYIGKNIGNAYAQSGEGAGYAGMYCSPLNQAWVNGGNLSTDCRYAVLKGT